ELGIHFAGVLAGGPAATLVVPLAGAFVVAFPAALVLGRLGIGVSKSRVSARRLSR
ncbi:MAG: hypothetical protein HW396_1377, partial [Candidatus Dadabacteria bacterium]|nr:hypothetical protein [Candidatus Dadabacteria bacterium]